MGLLINKPEFTWALIGVCGALLALALSGWVLVVIMCCKNRANKHNCKALVKQWESQSSQQSTLNRCLSPHVEITKTVAAYNYTSDTLEDNLNHVTYEQSPKLTHSYYPSNTVV